MKLIKEHKAISILVVVFIGLILLYLVRDFIINTTKYTQFFSIEEEYIMSPKTYDINEYSVTNISDQQMANIYLMDFRYLVYNDISSAYNLLDEAYRNAKFGNLDSFKNYINSINFNNIVDKYYVQERGNYTVYGVYDSNDNLFIFKTNGVMQYSVYLDEDTVEIW